MCVCVLGGGGGGGAREQRGFSFKFSIFRNTKLIGIQFF